MTFMQDTLPKLIEEKGGIRLDVGCGRAKQSGWVGMDKRPIKEADIIHNLEVIPWPLPSDCAIQVLCSHVLEHIDPRNFLDVMNEIHRVTKHDGQVLISTPYAGSYGAYQDPTHTRPGYNEASFHYLDPRPVNGSNTLYRIYEPEPYFIERCHFDTGGNIEVVMRVIKDRELVKKILSGKLYKNRKAEVVK